MTASQLPAKSMTIQSHAGRLARQRDRSRRTGTSGHFILSILVLVQACQHANIINLVKISTVWQHSYCVLLLCSIPFAPIFTRYIKSNLPTSLPYCDIIKYYVKICHMGKMSSHSSFHYWDQVVQCWLTDETYPKETPRTTDITVQLHVYHWSWLAKLKHVLWHYSTLIPSESSYHNQEPATSC